MPQSLLTIADLSAATGVSKHTLRYYETIGVLPQVQRDGSGRHRRYRPEHVRWVRFLRRLRETGMPIRDVRAYTKLALRGERSWPARRAMLAEHRDRVLATMETLRSHLAILDAKLAHGCDPSREPGYDEQPSADGRRGAPARRHRREAARAG